MMTTDHWMRPVTGSALVCGQREVVQLLLHYDPANPQLLELVTGYDATGRRTSWKLERNALSAALTEQRLVYTRGVVAWPIEDYRVAGGVLALERYGPGGAVRVFLPGGHVADTLANSYRQVPQGAEGASWDDVPAVLRTRGGGHGAR